MAPSPPRQRHAPSPEEAISFGAWLRQRRRALDLTQEALAQRVNCARITIRRIEAGDLKPSQQLAELLAEHLGVPPVQRRSWLQFARGLAPLPASHASDWPATLHVTRQLPPIRSPANLPSPITTFLGRHQEIRDAGRLITTSRLLTLTGAGGAGKTRLALEIARSLLDTNETDDAQWGGKNCPFRDGVWWVELAPLTDAMLIPEAVAKVLGLREQPDQPLDRLLLETLKTKSLLLLLDNCEHLAEGCAAWVHQWLHYCPDLHILATSREPLQLLGEQRFPVAPLAAAEASELFVQRAQLVDPAFTRTIANGAAIDQLCQQVDCLPLAIELLAARSDLFSPQALIERLQAQPLDLLSAEMRDLPARQRTLRRTIQHSYDLLPKQEQALFRTLGVFMGGFDRTAVAHLGFAEESLYALFHKSLVKTMTQPAGERRFMLLETLRAYADEQLNNLQEDQVVREHHARYFLAMAEHAYQQLGQATEIACYEQLEREHDNLRAALRWALTANPPLALQMVGALREFWCIRGHYTEGRQWLTQVLQQNSASPSAGRGRALLAAGKVAHHHDDFGQATAHFEEALHLYSQLDDQSGMANSLYFLGNLVRNQGDLPRAKSLLEQSLALQRSIGDSHGSTSALCDLAMIAMKQGDVHGGRSLLEEGLAIAHAANNGSRVAILHARYGLFELNQRAPHAASSHFRESIHLALRFGHLVMLVFCLWGMAEISAVYGEAEDAKQRAVRLLSAADALNKTMFHSSSPSDPSYQRSLASMRMALDEATFAQAWAEGQAMTLDEAVAYALAQ